MWGHEGWCEGLAGGLSDLLDLQLGVYQAELPHAG